MKSGNEELDQIVLEAVDEAVLQVKQMRVMEGQALDNDMNMHLHVHSSIGDSFRPKLAPTVVTMYKERLLKKVHEFVGGQIDEARILTEVAVFADKADINEELTRLK